MNFSEKGSESMDVWVVNAQENPPQSRDVEGRRMWRSNTLCEVLADSGDTVTRWRSSFSHQAKRQLSDHSATVATDNYTHQYIRCTEYHHHVGLARIRSHRSLATEFLRLASSQPVLPDIIHACNVPLELGGACVEFGQKHGIPVVIDVRDLWPDSYLNFLPSQLSVLEPALKTALNSSFLGSRKTYARATALTAITKPILDWALEKAGRPETTFDLVFPMAYPSVPVPPQAEMDAFRQKLGVPLGVDIAVYSGNVGYQTDFDTMLNAAKAMEARQPPLHFVIAGSGPRVQELRERSAAVSNFHVPGWLEGPDLAKLLHTSTFGLIGFFNTVDYVMSIPNKFVEYLSAGLPIICGTNGEMQTLTKTHDCGTTFQIRDHLSLVAALDVLANSPERLATLTHNATQLHAERFSVDRVYTQMADHLRDVCTRRTVGA